MAYLSVYGLGPLLTKKKKKYNQMTHSSTSTSTNAFITMYNALQYDLRFIFIWPLLWH